MFKHDIIKKMYSEQGYLPNYPYHLISDEEMFGAFIPLDCFSIDTDTDSAQFDEDRWNRILNEDVSYYFIDNYPYIGVRVKDEYFNVVTEIGYWILKYLGDSTISIPDWVYSYMLGQVIGPNSSKQDIHDLLVMMRVDNLDDIFDETAGIQCVEFSTRWVNSIVDAEIEHRPITPFGEHHVVKYLRLREVK